MEATTKRDTQRANINRAELAECISRAVPKDGLREPIIGLHLNRASLVKEPAHSVSTPAFCVIAQGAKEVHLGETCYRYDPSSYLLTTVELPVVSQLVTASPEKPYLSLRLNLVPAQVASVLLEAGTMPPPRRENGLRAIDVSPLGADLLDAAVRLVRLVEAPPDEARVLLPLLTREIIFRLLAGEQGARLRHIAVTSGQTSRIARAIERLRHDYNKPLPIAHLARDVGMSSSGFYEHFKSVTALSPLQFQKQLRLQEARRLLLGDDVDAASAAFRVGYEDPSQFSREYKRLFGYPPMRDVERLRGEAKAAL